MNQDIYVVIEHVRGQVADISYVMLVAARVLANETGGKVVAVLLGQNAHSLAHSLASDYVLYGDHPALAEFSSDAYQYALGGIINEKQPRAALFGSTTIGADVAGLLSARLGLPLVSACLKIRAENGTLKFVSQICGGKILAEGDLPGPTALLTMVPGSYRPEDGKATQPPQVIPINIPTIEALRVTLEQYVEPEAGDIDISREPILISIGRGIQNQDNIELAEDLARALGGVVSASRPVVDQGWLPATRLVGKSGKTVKPKIYLALGISGAPEHSEAIIGSECIIAINTDPAAPIFNLAKYGVVADLFELVPLLTEKIGVEMPG